MTDADIIKQASDVLAMNDRGNYTQPAHGLYPHQWFWDSCFIAVGLRHLDVERAMVEVSSLLRGQWHNGMIPNIIFRDEAIYRPDRNLYRSWLNIYSPDDVATSGNTQPPMLAEAVFQIGKKLTWPKRKTWYKSVYPALIEYHQWLYAERDPHGEGLVLLIHPWETGMDNTPPWMKELHEHSLPLWIKAIEKSGLERVINLFRRDIKSIPMDERFSTIESLALLDAQRRLRRKAYDIDKILDHGMFAIEDVAFNSILIKANRILRDIAKSLDLEVPEELKLSMSKTETAIEELWNEEMGQYYSRDFITHRLLRQSSMATLMPLYSGVIKPERAERLVKLIESEKKYGPAWPIPSVSVDSANFHPRLYWQGPTWVNMNWLIIDGLKQYKYDDHASALAESTIDMVGKSGCYEYFDPLSGKPAGAENFSWTAALVIDLIKTKSAK